ncbi:NAD(P)-binding protein [Corynespora cassiicola Philippines]|uniref:NAD(P)-binding protein n=1 Tax=Corynespora cassiicola Philippines TaxID=1448308 RepID=A0A2T2P1I7_CORCC|nr:NAD(P)-binding protein [Corynespora cassiicola Philippines]
MAAFDTFTISDGDLEGIKDQVVVITGASSGIGLATVKRLVQHGAKVYAADVNPLPEPLDQQIPFLKVDVTSWTDQLSLFKAAKEKYGHIDHVFANAGIKPTASLLEDDLDSNGDLLPPKLNTYNVNFLGCMYTTKLAIHYIKQNPNGGSIVLTGSGSSFTRFSPTDYTATKHGVLGMMRALYCTLHPNLPIRINAIAPSWTDTGIMPREFVAAIQDMFQSADVVARSVAVLMADKKRHGELIYSERGRFFDLENGENGFHKYTLRALGQEENPEETGMRRAMELAAKAAAVATGAKE